MSPASQDLNLTSNIFIKFFQNQIIHINCNSSLLFFYVSISHLCLL